MDSPVAVNKALSQLRAAMVRRLFLWGLLSVGLGLVLLGVGGGPLLQGLATQAVAWGVINAAIALGGAALERRRVTARNQAPRAEDVTREARHLRRLLLFNTGLDVLYVVAGLAAALLLGTTNALWRGYGWGIALQGAFLFVFDLIHVQLVPPGVVLLPLDPFGGPEHLPFLLEGGRPAALLVHGFPGTPAEMRALGESLHRAGWTVQGLLLPGFGSDLPTLVERRYDDWLSAIQHALDELRQGHTPLLLVGYSLGAALATAVAARDTSVLHPRSGRPPRPAEAVRPALCAGVDGLILLAPFVWDESPLQRWLWRPLRPLLPRYFQPFRLFDLSNPQARRLLANLMPRLDLDDVRVQEQLRQVRLPLSLFDQVRKAGQGALQSAPRLSIPTLVVVGKQDELASAARIQPLLRRIRPAPMYLEVEAAHDLTSAGSAHWPVLEASVLDFAANLQRARQSS